MLKDIAIYYYLHSIVKSDQGHVAKVKLIHLTLLARFATLTAKTRVLNETSFNEPNKNDVDHSVFSVLIGRRCGTVCYV